MKRKAEKIFQIAAIALFALALLAVLLGTLFQNTPAGVIRDASAYTTDGISVFPVASTVCACIRLAIALIPQFIFKKANSQRKLIAAAIGFCAVFFVFNGFLIDRVYSHIVSTNIQKQAALHFPYGIYLNLETMLAHIAQALAVPANLLLFIALGSAVVNAAKREAAIASEVGANASEAFAQAAASPLQKPSDGSPFTKRDFSGNAAYYAAFKRPAHGSAGEPPNDGEE